ncbi:hypothetical protein FOXYSP1_06517 [Fusarium oxysporum f. sp. phaseoli]
MAGDGLSSHAGIEDEVTTTSDTGKDGFGFHTVETPEAEAFLARVNQLRHDITFSATSDPSPIEQGFANDSAKSSLLSSSYDHCRLTFDTSLFDLGKTFVNYHLGPTANQPDGQDPHQEQDTVITPPPPPGTAFFEQALVLLKLPFEEPSLEHIEILKLARLRVFLTDTTLDTHVSQTFYSYSLNWKKAAYMYAGTSVRMSQQIKLDYPSDQQLEPGDVDQFFEADLLRARIQLTLMKAEADIFIDLWQSIRDDIPDGERRVRPILLRLENWLHELPPSLKFDCEDGMPEAMAQAPNMRSLASLYLRWQQIGSVAEVFKPMTYNIY